MKITDEVYALDSTRGNYAYLIRGAETVLVDSGLPWQGKGILRDLHKMGVAPHEIHQILLTHNDADHIGNAAMLQQASGATLWISADEMPVILGQAARAGIKKYIGSIFKVERPNAITPYPAEQRLGDFEIIPSPGHTRGHVCLLYKDVLLAGDLVGSSRGRLQILSALMTWDKILLVESIRKVGAYSFKWVCPAHGEPLERGDRWEKLVESLVK
jgi:glyoxylase-like metal-dependent hydrolase (beta-lactamase superfamily II)